MIDSPSTRKTERRAVVGLSRVRQRGFVGPLTRSGRIAVEGVVASCYADVFGHSDATAHTAMQPLLWLSRVFPALAEQPAGHTDIHWYAQILVQLVEMGDRAASRLGELAALLPDLRPSASTV